MKKFTTFTIVKNGRLEPLFLLLLIFLCPAFAGGGTFTENFNSEEKKSIDTTADWNIQESVLTLPTTVLKPLHPDEFVHATDGTSERGYIFKPVYDGKITSLGRYRHDNYEGNTIVRLWSNDGVLLSSATVDDTPGWSFKNISPVEVSSGTYYRVSVICDSKRAYFNTQWPSKRGLIHISTPVESDGQQGFPDETKDDMWGVPDIEFVSEYIYPSTGVSKGYDTEVQEPLYLDFTSSITLNGGDITYLFSDSPDDNSWTEWTENLTGLSQRYLRWKAVLDSPSSALAPKIHNLKINYNCPPQKPVPFSPPTGQEINTLKPEFTWENSYDLDGDTLTYNLQISSVSGFSTVYLAYNNILEGNDGDTDFAVPDYLYHSPWYWRIEAEDPYSTSGWSDHFQVWVDTIPPAAITDLLSSMGSANREIDLRWSEPSDTGKTETVSGYTIKYATTPLTEDVWSKAPEVPDPPLPASPSNSRFYTVPGLEDNRFYYLGITTEDGAGNRSEISNIAVSSTNFSPEINLTAPHTGEVLSGTVPVKWNYSDITVSTHSFFIKLSADDGNTYDTDIVSDLPDKTTYYIWDTMEIPNHEYHLKVTVKDKLGLFSSSTAAVTVDNANVPPWVNLKQPDGKETWKDKEEIIWDYGDENPFDEIYFDIFISSTGGNSWVTETENLYYDDGLTGGTTNYYWDTTAYPDGHRYRVKIIAHDGLATGTATSKEYFILFNKNRPPEEFSLIYPESEREIKVLYPTFNWEDSDDPDIPKGDSFTYRLYYSKDEQFENYSLIEDINVSSYTLKIPLDDYTEYWWKVSAIDEAGAETFNTEGSVNFYLRWSEADSEDGKITISSEQNLPENGYFNIERSGETEKDFIQTANNNAIGDPSIRTLDNGSVYKAQIKDRETGDTLSVPDLISKVTMEYQDSKNDGYLDCCGASAEFARIFRYENGLWRLASDNQSVNAAKNRVTARDVESLSIFAIHLYSAPQEHLSEVRNFPNPFRAGERETEIVYTLNEDSRVNLKFYTIAGDLVYIKKFEPGSKGGKGNPEGYTNRVAWKGYNKNGRIVADGIYILSVDAKGEHTGTSSREKRLIGVEK